MNAELGLLENKVVRIVALCENLRAENRRLHERLNRLEEENESLIERMGEARNRLEDLMDRLPPE